MEKNTEHLLASVTEHFQRKIDSRDDPDYRPKNVYASGLYIPCARKLYHDMVDAGKREKITVERQVRFDRGNHMEAWWTSTLTHIGALADPPFHFEGGQERVSITGKDGNVVLTGKIDGKIRFSDGTRVPIEIKKWRDSLWQKADSVESMQANVWTAGAVSQILGYLFGLSLKDEARKDYEYGLLWADGPGFPKVTEVYLKDHLDTVEKWLGLSETACLHASTGSEPPQGVDRPDLCNRCWWQGKECFPELRQDPLGIIVDEEFEDYLAEYVKLKPAAEQFARVKRRIDERFRGTEEALCGDYLIKGKWSKKTFHPYPPWVKRKWCKEDPVGRYSLRVEKV
ncbi:hypothetical protein LCGC14_0427860 [marine sediment metagenome]|uniref:PD-(D/E)XK endonuclease-like domain-containing protein n=1 Tax=marine sediment metagenome TaxID=412755 RepID=A0A0F9VB79_9ZZZZ